MSFFFFFFFFNDTATTEIYTLSLHDALPILAVRGHDGDTIARGDAVGGEMTREGVAQDRKSTRLNSSHDQISYAVFCLKKKKKYKTYTSLYRNHVSGNAALYHAMQEYVHTRC